LLAAEQCTYLVSCVIGYVCCGRRREVNVGGWREDQLCIKKLKEYSDKNMKEKLWSEFCETVVTNWSELPAEQKSEKAMLIFFFILLGITLMMLIYWAEAYIL
jgi:hypothetical protein